MNTILMMGLIGSLLAGLCTSIGAIPSLLFGRLGERIETRTERALGVKVPPHAFRDAAATAIATGDPGNYGHAASVLGHARLATTMRYYTIAGTKEAVAGHADTLERLRREASRKNRRTPE